MYISLSLVHHRYRSKLLSFPWHGLWWVVLLQYTHVVHTSMSILNCPMIDDQDTGGAPVRSYASILSCIAGIFRRAKFSLRPFWLYYSKYSRV